MSLLFDFHRTWGYVAIVLNGLAGIYALLAWRYRKLRSVWVVRSTIVAEAALLIQVAVGIILISSKDYTAPRFHIFYGYVAFITIGAVYTYRKAIRRKRELWLGLIGLFLMGVGIRAVLQVVQ
ncbi:MAG: hypothetical protein JWL73_3984 [Actinomycetia bacterium]|nr:hypothetical protein [Actinomycetes bacterium]